MITIIHRRYDNDDITLDFLYNVSQEQKIKIHGTTFRIKEIVDEVILGEIIRHIYLKH
jgi:hypothetical protein